MNLFICHAQDDGDFAELLKTKVEEDGHEAWLDSEDLVAGEEWQQEIDQHIRNADALIFIASPRAERSKWVNYEWAFALGAGVRVIPVLLVKTPLHPRLRALQALDFTNRASRPWSRLLKALAGGQKSRVSAGASAAMLRP